MHKFLLLLLIFTLTVYLPTRSLAITIVRAQFLTTQLDDSSSSSSSYSNQTVRLFNKTELSKKPIRPLYIVESIPVEALHSFRVIDHDDDSDVYLTFRNSTSTLARFSHCVLLLSNDIAINVTFIERSESELKTDFEQISDESNDGNDLDDDDSEPNQPVRLTIEYIFKLGNNSRFGLIKDDTPVNGILCIIKVFSNSPPPPPTQTQQQADEHDQIDVRIGSDYFQVKRFQKQFYMVQLVKTREVLRLDRLFEVNVEAYMRGSKIRLGRSRVRFLVVRSQEMDIRLDRHENSRIDVELDEDDGRLWRVEPYGGRFIAKIDPYLSRAVFLDDDGMERYVRDNVRFRIESSNYPHFLVEIDSQKGRNKFPQIYI